MRISVLGYTGRVGSLIVDCIKKRRHEFVCGVSSRSGNVCDLTNADVVVDFSSPTATMQLLQCDCVTPLVIGTTGLDDTHVEALRRSAKSKAVFYAANMSIGIAIINSMLEQYVAKLQKYDVDILDIHHKHKKDAPSGTAVMLGNTLKSCGCNVSFASQRCGNIAGIHEISFTNSSERITIKHESYTKELFAKGAVDIAEWIVHQKPGLYSINDYLGV